MWSVGAFLFVSDLATIIRPAWHGLPRKTTPKWSRSWRGAALCIISRPQHSRPPDSRGPQVAPAAQVMRLSILTPAAGKLWWVWGPWLLPWTWRLGAPRAISGRARMDPLDLPSSAHGGAQSKEQGEKPEPPAYHPGLGLVATSPSVLNTNYLFIKIDNLGGRLVPIPY